MNLDHENQLEKQIDAELKALGDLAAPSTLSPRVMRVIAERSRAHPWYRMPWPSWSLAWRIASLTGLLALFAGLCAGVLVLTNSGVWQEGTAQVGVWFKSAELVLKVMEVLQAALLTSARHLGPWAIACGVALVVAVWVACVGLSTVFVRLGMQPVMNRD